MTVPARIGIVTLGVADLETSSAFYAALGWDRAESSNEQIVWFRTAGSYLGLFPFASLAADAALPETPRNGFGGVTLAINVPSEQHVDDALAAAAAAGASILKLAQQAEWGGYSGYFADPDGYPWEVAYNPHFPLDEHGALHIP